MTGAGLVDRELANVIAEWKRDRYQTPAQALPQAAPVVETKEQRQDRRLQACVDAGLQMFTHAASIRLPDGVGNLADSEGVTRQTFSTDVKAALKRWVQAKKNGLTVRRT